MNDHEISGSTKRKHVDDSTTEVAGKKRKKAKKPKQMPGEDFDHERGLNLAIGRMDSQELIGYVDSRTKQFEPKISDMELEDQRLPGTLTETHITSSMEVRD